MAKSLLSRVGLSFTLLLLNPLAMPSWALWGDIFKANSEESESYHAAIQSVCQKILKESERLGLKNLKVYPFVEQKALIPELSEHLRNQFNVALAGSDKFKVLLGDDLQIKKEMISQLNAYYDPSEGAKLGKLLGATHVLMGNFRDNPDKELLYFQPLLVDVQTGTISLGFEEIPLRYRDLPCALKGVLTLECDVDGAEVLIDGKPTGNRTPLSMLSLSVGAHQVELRSGEWGTLFQQVAIRREGARASFAFRDSNATLELIPNVGGCKVFLNGEPIETGVSCQRPGSYKLDIQKEGYHPYSTTFQLRANENLKFTPNLVPLPRHVSPLGFDLHTSIGLTNDLRTFDTLGGSVTFAVLPLLDLRLGGGWTGRTSVYRPSSYSSAPAVNPFSGWYGEAEALLSTHQLGWTLLTPYLGYGLRYGSAAFDSAPALNYLSRNYVAGIRLLGLFFAEVRTPDHRDPLDPARPWEGRFGVGLPTTR